MFLLSGHTYRSLYSILYYFHLKRFFIQCQYILFRRASWIDSDISALHGIIRHGIKFILCNTPAGIPNDSLRSNNSSTSMSAVNSSGAAGSWAI